ncbi:hypothetical protein [Kitasatospora saccharophila]|uniref:hypothetical protein n=1 Tax=Kitasatospora saccharophila TaxID=407973 RepID=UPI0031D17C5C
MAAVCGAVLAGAVGCTSDGPPAAVRPSGAVHPSPGGGTPAAGSVAGSAPVAAADGSSAFGKPAREHAAAMLAQVEQVADTRSGTLSVAHYEEKTGYLTWTRTDGTWCLGVAERTGRSTDCIDTEYHPHREQPSLGYTVSDPSGDGWLLLVDADGEELVGVECGGAALEVVRVAGVRVDGEPRTYYLVLSDGQLTGDPVARVRRGGEVAVEPLPKDDDPVAGLPTQSC